MVKKIIPGVVYFEPPASEETKRDIREIPAPVLKEMAKNMFRTPTGDPCPVHFSHEKENELLGPAPLGQVILADSLEDGTCLAAVEVDTDDPRVKAMLDAVGPDAWWCFSLGHSAKLYPDGRVEYFVSDMTLTGLGGRNHTIVLNEEAIDRLIDTASGMGIALDGSMTTTQEKSADYIAAPPVPVDKIEEIMVFASKKMFELSKRSSFDSLIIVEFSKR